MIHLLTQLIRQHPEWLRSPGAILSFMKVSTPASGTELGKGKALLFVFEEGETLPTLCMKTTRTYSAGSVIRQSYANLNMLRDEVEGSEYSEMFAEPLYLYDDGDLIFSIETICSGATFSAEAHSITLFV